ncbi:anthranilate synthase component I [soil metagenome]
MNLAAFIETVEARRRAGSDRALAVPIARRRSADLLTPVSAFLALRGDDPDGSFSFLLESVEGGERLGRYSFLGKLPYCIVEARGESVLVSTPSGAASGDGALPDVREENDSIFNVMDHMLAQFEEVRMPGLPRFTGGAVGFVGYDAVRILEDLPDEQVDALGLPDAVWAFYDTIAAFDHARRQLVLIATAFVPPDMDPEAAYAEAEHRLDALEQDLIRPPYPGEPVRLRSETMLPNVSRRQFEDAVIKAKEHIQEGDIFQVVISQRFSTSFEGDPFNLYRALRQINPSPYLFYLDLSSIGDDGLPSGAFQLIGSSPEVLVRLERDVSGAGRAELLPIAGTRPRGETPAEDAALEAELASDEKERAEHLMLVDLGRNDLGRVCETGSVSVDRYATVERYSHVMHLVSSVVGDVSADRTAMEVLAACFPAGTVTGAPKVRAMSLIDELEPERRGPYAGAVGYVDYGGTLDTCITIRTMITQGGTAHVQAGAGIVADSDPASEYHETRHKARALRAAIAAASSDLL